MFQVVHCSIVVFVVLQVIPLLLTVCYVSDNAVHCFRLLFFCVSGDTTVSDSCLSCVSGDAAVSDSCLLCLR